MEPVRFDDPVNSLWQFTYDILVHCPRCDGRANIRIEAERDRSLYGHPARRLTCTACGYFHHWTFPWQANERGAKFVVSFGGVNPSDATYLGVPLWLTTGCCGHILWAYNIEHLDLLERYVSADLRERRRPFHGGQSVVERLPAWIKAAKNRDEVLSGLQRLRVLAA